MKRIDEIRKRCNAATQDISYLLGEIERLERENALLKEMYATVSAGKVEADARLTELEHRTNMAHAVANNVIYFNDRADYLTVLYQVCMSLFPEDDEDGIGAKYTEMRGPREKGG